MDKTEELEKRVKSRKISRALIFFLKEEEE